MEGRIQNRDRQDGQDRNRSGKSKDVNLVVSEQRGLESYLGPNPVNPADPC